MGTLNTLRFAYLRGLCPRWYLYGYTELYALLVGTTFNIVHATCTFWTIDTDSIAGRGEWFCPTSQTHFNFANT